MPRRSKSSGCFRGSSIISLILFSSSSSPPTSSYVIWFPRWLFAWGCLRGVSLTTIFVRGPTMTGPLGTVDTTAKVERLPMRAMLGTMMSVSAISGRFISPFRNMLSIPSSKRVRFPSGIFGARVICSAGCGTHLRTVTLSSTLTPAFVLVSPSMKSMPRPSSSGSHLKTLATTDLLPTISTVSPSSSPSSDLDVESILARPYPASLWDLAIATFRVIESGMMHSGPTPPY